MGQSDSAQLGLAHAALVEQCRVTGNAYPYALTRADELRHHERGESQLRADDRGTAATRYPGQAIRQGGDEGDCTWEAGVGGELELELELELEIGD
jgi:hypothetical protein